MGAGRKTETLTLKEKSGSWWSVNCSVTARNLRKSDLAGVIFGCKHDTIKECFEKCLFGLPAPHFSYVRNIGPALPLFLFNYSDRKLHGVFEASTPGKLNIDQYAWSDGSENTSYAAQVKIRIRMRCQPLQEDQFSPIIADNYYDQRLFWFELDANQTKSLISLFSSSSLSKNVHEIGRHPYFLVMDIQKKEELANSASLRSSTGLTYSAVVQNTSAPVDSGKSDLEDPFTSGEENRVLEAEINKEPGENHMLGPEHQHSSFSTFSSFEVRNASKSSQLRNWSSLFKASPASEASKEFEDRERLVSELNISSSIEHVNSRYNVECNSSSDVMKETISNNNDCEDVKADWMVPDYIYSSGTAILHDMRSSDLQSILAKLMEEVEGLKLSRSKQFQMITSLEQELVGSKLEIQHLKNKCKKLECGSIGSRRRLECGLVSDTWLTEGDGFELTDDLRPNLDQSLLIVGGFDGTSWLPALDFYNSFYNKLESLSHMNLIRPNASAVKLNSEVYIFGGGDQSLWYDTVESYNLVTNKWVSRPSLNQRKGNIAGVSCGDRIFAIGGVNAVDCFSEVEMYDLYIGRWIPTQQLQHKRLASTAVEVNGVVYVVGGFDGKDYLRSVERFDPREGSWRGLENISTKRACHSLVVLNEKLYALGGYNGNQMVSTVEVFDPRLTSWMMAESMNNSRGYFGAVVSGDAIYVLGGRQNDGRVLDTVEYYKEGHGWHCSNMKPTGKRCCFSAIIL